MPQLIPEEAIVAQMLLVWSIRGTYPGDVAYLRRFTNDLEVAVSVMRSVLHEFKTPRGVEMYAEDTFIRFLREAWDASE